MLKNPNVYAIIWAIIAVLAAYTSANYFIHWSANTWLFRILAVVLGLLCVASVIRIGNALHWWNFFYGPGQ